MLRGREGTEVYGGGRGRERALTYARGGQRSFRLKCRALPLQEPVPAQQWLLEQSVPSTGDLGKGTGPGSDDAPSVITGATPERCDIDSRAASWRLLGGQSPFSKEV